MKKCSTCKQTKLTSSFTNNKAQKDNLNNQCKDCHKIRMKISNKRYYKKNREKEMLRHYAALDKTNNRYFDISVEWMKENITSKPCFYCGTTEEPVGCDRIDNDLGHTEDNVVPCCKVCNKVRNNHFTVEEMKTVGRAIAQVKAARL